jgi:tRNA1(Val) A37 N6-methylase TrmN6
MAVSSKITATTEDAFLGGLLTIEQTLNGSRAGIDAVFLAAACPAKAGQAVLELGSGSGVVALAVAARVEGITVTGIEIDPELCALAQRNAARNNLGERARFVCGDVAAPLSRVVSGELRADRFDHAVANPPFLTSGDTRPPADPRLRRAHALEPGELEKWVRTLAAFVRPGGTATIVHRADALPELLKHCAGRFGALTVYPLFPRQGEAASRILLQGVKGSRAPLRLLPGMVLHEDGRAFTRPAQAILRHGASLDLSGRN